MNTKPKQPCDNFCIEAVDTRDCLLDSGDANDGQIDAVEVRLMAA